MGEQRDRKTALATAGAVAIGALTAALAIGANFGLFGLAAAERQEFVPASSGDEATTTTTSTTALEPVIETRVVDIPVDDPVQRSDADRGPSASSGPSDNRGPGSTSSGHGHDHDDDDDDDLDDDDDDRGRNRGPGGGGDDDEDDD